jgi:hypothetical protein
MYFPTKDNCMRITESDIMLTGASMAQDDKSIDPLHMIDQNNVVSSGDNRSYPFTAEDIRLGQLFLKRLGTYDRALKLFDYLQRKDQEYEEIANEQSGLIGGIAANMPDDDNDFSSDMQGYMNSSTNPGANGSDRNY